MFFTINLGDVKKSSGKKSSEEILEEILGQQQVLNETPLVSE
jgi:hypothetical protein